MLKRSEPHAPGRLVVVPCRDDNCHGRAKLAPHRPHQFIVKTLVVLDVNGMERDWHRPSHFDSASGEMAHALSARDHGPDAHI